MILLESRLFILVTVILQTGTFSRRLPQHEETLQEITAESEPAILNAEFERPNTFCQDAFAISEVHQKFEVRNVMENVTIFCTRPIPPTLSEIRDYLISDTGKRENIEWLDFDRDCDLYARPTYELLKVNSTSASLNFPGDPLSSTQKEMALQALREALEICDLRSTNKVITLESKAELYRLVLRSYATRIPMDKDS